MARVQIDIGANDGASRVLNNIHSTLGSMGTRATALSFAFNEITSAIGKVVATLQPLVDAAISFEKIDSTMKVAAGSSSAAAAELAFVRAEAQRLGLSFSETAISFAKFAVAAKGTALEGEGARKVFSAVASASAALKLSTDETNGALTAIQQMMSKGTVSSEELRGQLGERLPGAFNLAAKAMGVTTAQLGKMLEQGQIAATDLLPKLAAELENTYGGEAAKGAESLQGSLNRFNDAMKETAGQVGASLAPAIKLVLEGVISLAKAFTNLLSWVEIFAIGGIAAFDKLAVKLGGVLSGDIFTAEGRARMQQQLDNINLAAEESFRELEQKYGIHQQNMATAGDAGANTAEAQGQKRRDAAKKTGDDLVKIQQAYAAAMGDEEAKLTAEYEKSYQERVKAVTAFYDNLKTQATSNKEEEQYQQMKLNRLKELEQQHAQDIGIIRSKIAADNLAKQQGELDQQIQQIQRAAADRVITERQAEQQIAELTISSLKTQYDARKATADKIAEVYGKNSEQYKSALAEQDKAFKSYNAATTKEYVAAAKAAIETRRTFEAAYKASAERIRAIDKSIADYRAGIEDRIRGIRQKGMTDEQKYADNLIQLEQNKAKAKEALARGDYDAAMKYAKKAEDLAAGIADKELKATDEAGKRAEVQANIANATNEINKVEQIGLEILKAKKAEEESRMDKLKEIQALKLDPKSFEVNIDSASLSQLQSEIDRLTRTETKTIRVVTENVGGGKTTGYFAGGKVMSGVASHDSTLAMLAKNEWIINNTAARFLGDGFMHAVNTLNIPKMAALLPQVAPAAGANMGTINLQLGGDSFPLSGSVDVVGQLMTAVRRAKRARGH